MEIYLHISAGSGPRECEWVVVKTANQFAKEAKADGLNAEVMWEAEPVANAPSLLLKIDGKGADAFVRARTGSIKWIGESPYRPNHKRKNWFVSVRQAPSIADVPALNERDITFQSMRASGPGGQHVNTTDSAVRATHNPSGASVVSREERSQHRNKKLAITKLALIFTERQSGEEATNREAMWRQNHALERGNEVRVYIGPKFKLK